MVSGDLFVSPAIDCLSFTSVVAASSAVAAAAAVATAAAALSAAYKHPATWVGLIQPSAGGLLLTWRRRRFSR